MTQKKVLLQAFAVEPVGGLPVEFVAAVEAAVEAVEAVEAAAKRKVIIQPNAIDHQRGTVVHIDIKKSTPLKR